MASIIEAKELAKTYGDGTKAVQGISFDVREGEFFGFLGPNGAGKSTTIKILTTLLRKTSGQVWVAGRDIDNGSKEIRKLIGVQSQETSLDGDLTGRENLVLQGHFHQMPDHELNERVNEVLKLTDLEDSADRRAAFYSGGMKKRLDLASALVHKPKLLFLDEPTTGLDPQSRAKVWSYLEKLNKEEGITIFLTTQYLEEADRLCHRLAIIDRGLIQVTGSPEALKQQIGADTITISLPLNVDGSSKELKRRARQIVSRIQGVKEVLETDSGLTIYAKNGGLLIPDLVRTFDENKIGLSSVSLSSPTLDDVFLKHTGRRIRTDEPVRPLSRREMLRSRR
jgi:ABC-2 type transport system ATP-binding protein